MTKPVTLTITKCAECPYASATGVEDDIRCRAHIMRLCNPYPETIPKWCPAMTQEEKP